MLKRYIILQPIGNNKGSGVVTVTDTTVTVSIKGTAEEYRTFFMGSASANDDIKIDAGTVRGGYAKSFTLKKEDASKIDTVVLLKGNEPMIYGSLIPTKRELSAFPEEAKSGQEESSVLGIDDGFSWVKIEDGRFAENCPIIKYIFENINVLYRINVSGYYYYGSKNGKNAVAVPSEEGGRNPFTHISDCARFINGYWTVGVDKKEKYFFSLVD
ncbi:MAG: hypothetical protein Q4G23_10800 [Clostridia bacterium]|nr:hypothetical protein [Clostridia bacterium]